MGTKELLDAAMKLKPAERLALLEGTLDAIWAEEAEKRLQAYEAGTLKTIPASELLGD